MCGRKVREEGAENCEARNDETETRMVNMTHTRETRERAREVGFPWVCGDGT